MSLKLVPSFAISISFGTGIASQKKVCLSSTGSIFAQKQMLKMIESS